MKKLSILAAFALSAALILSGCNPNAEDETADGTGTTTETEATAGTEGSTSGTTDSGSTSTDSGSSSSGDEKAKSYSVNFATSTIKDAYCGTFDGTNPVVGDIPTAGSTGFEVVSGTDKEGNPKDFVKIISVDSDGVLTIAGYSWDKTYITLAEVVDLSSYKKLTITAKVAEGFVAGDNGQVIFEVASGDEAASGVSTWTDSTFFGNLTTEYSSFSIGMEKFANMNTKDGDNSVYGSTVADMTAIKEICINPRGATGNIYIKSIIFE